MILAIVVRKNFLLTGGNFEQNHTQCSWPSAATAWKREVERRDGGGGETERGRKTEKSGSLSWPELG